MNVGDRYMARYLVPRVPREQAPKKGDCDYSGRESIGVKVRNRATQLGKNTQSSRLRLDQQVTEEPASCSDCFQFVAYLGTSPT